MDFDIDRNYKDVSLIDHSSISLILMDQICRITPEAIPLAVQIVHF